MKTIVVSKNSSFVAWLDAHGYEYDEVLTRASKNDVMGNIVIGAIPYYLGTLASEVGVIEIPHVPHDFKRRDMTVEEMDKFGANLKWYAVDELEDCEDEDE